MSSVTQRPGGTSSSFEEFLVPVARSMPSNAEYLKHLSKSDGPGLIRLASNENTEPPSPRVRQALIDCYEDANLSPPPIPPLRLALAEHHGVGADQVLVTAGSTEVIDATLRTFVRAGDEVVLPDPLWPVCRRRLQALEAKVAAIPLLREETSMRYDVDGIVVAVTPATKLIVLCTPHNPGGNAMAPEEIRRVAELGVPLLIDAAYSDFDPDVDLMALAAGYPHVMITRTFSKAYCLAGLRVGYGVSSPELVDYVDRFLVPGSAVSSAALRAGLAALQDREYHAYQVSRIIAERERLTAKLRELGYTVWDSKCNFVSVDASGYPGGGDALAEALLGEGVVVRPFDPIVRISIGTRSENDALLAAMQAVLR
ncbi:MAG TPA: histidinol-phosphate transaminase [Solirubrobacteraceae bacterium]|nr:histidinol-phosphate transaminase [Solirubrobacteraceae bacterium]